MVYVCDKARLLLASGRRGLPKRPAPDLPLGKPSRSASLMTGLSMNVAKLWEEDGQDIAEYAIMLAVILAIVVGTIRLIGSNANNVFSSVASAVQ